MGRGIIRHDGLTAEWDSVSEKNRQLVTEFLRYCRSADKSPQTIREYDNSLRVFFCWNYRENGDKFFIDLKRRDFVYYFGWLQEMGLSTNRIALLKSVLSSLSTKIELLYEDLYPSFHNQLRALEPVHITTVREKTIITDADMARMLQKLKSLGKYQMACYLALACASGSRKAELLQMKVSFFCPEREVFDGYMYCTPEVRAKGRGKAGKIIKKYVIKELFQPFFDLWMEERKKLGITCDALFVTRVGTEWVPATVSTANYFAKTISEICGVNYYAHCSRHFFCTLLKQKKLPDDVIVQIFSWAEGSGSQMISIYDDTSKEEKLEKFFIDFNKTLKGDEAKGDK